MNEFDRKRMAEATEGVAPLMRARQEREHEQSRRRARDALVALATHLEACRDLTEVLLIADEAAIRAEVNLGPGVAEIMVWGGGG